MASISISSITDDDATEASTEAWTEAWTEEPPLSAVASLKCGALPPVLLRAVCLVNIGSMINSS